MDEKQPVKQKEEADLQCGAKMRVSGVYAPVGARCQLGLAHPGPHVWRQGLTSVEWIGGVCGSDRQCFDTGPGCPEAHHCTLEKGHVGDHAAHYNAGKNDEVIVAMWPKLRIIRTVHIQHPNMAPGSTLCGKEVDECAPLLRYDGLEKDLAEQPAEYPLQPCETCKMLRDTAVILKAKPGAQETTAKELCWWDLYQKHVHAVAKSKGWWDAERNDAEMLCLMHSELSEALEGMRHGNPASDHIPQFFAIEEELADVVIRIMDFAEARGHRVREAIEAKAKFNMSREYRHGGKEF